MLRSFIVIAILLFATERAQAANEALTFKMYYMYTNSFVAPIIQESLVKGCVEAKTNTPEACQKMAMSLIPEMTAYLAHRLTTEKTFEDTKSLVKCGSNFSSPKCAEWEKYIGSLTKEFFATFNAMAK